MVFFPEKTHYDFDDLVALVRILRAPDGCPWDSVQTHQSIRRNFIEEVYEACEAIDLDDAALLKEELGDVLLHVVFHAGIEADAGRFTIDDVCDGVGRKMISRHPNLFGAGSDLNWDEIKRKEKGLNSLSQELDSVARSLPALWRAEKMQKKAEDSLPVPVAENALDADPEQAVGDLLFSAVAVARRYGIDPEQALHRRCDAYLLHAKEYES